MRIKIGNVEVSHGLFLAPMAGFTDYAFRQICRRHGAEYTVSEMVSAKALCYEQMSKKNSAEVCKTASLCTVREEEIPMAIQLFGSDPEYIAHAAQMIENCNYKGCISNVAPTAIDINMGCPMHKIVGNGEGSALMKNPSLAADIVSATVNSLKNTPVTAKIRAGWDVEHKNAAEMAKMLEAAGASLICVHARTKEEMYNPGIDLSLIESVKKSVNIPVIGNGDITSADDALKMIDKTGCDGIMIGRGAIGNPWLFEEIAARIDGREFTPPSLEERLDECISHIRMIRDDKGELTGGAEIKKHAVMYIKNVHSAASVRDSIMKAHKTDEIEQIVLKLKSQLQ